jgi:hypothetical protein
MDTNPNSGSLTTITAIAILGLGIVWIIQAIVEWINGARPVVSTALAAVMIGCGLWMLLTRPPAARG